MGKKRFTITGCEYYFGLSIFEKGMKVKLIKEPDNKYDSEAIRVELKGHGKVGYVGNSTHTVITAGFLTNNRGMFGFGIMSELYLMWRHLYRPLWDIYG